MKIFQNVTDIGLGFDNLPTHIAKAAYLSGNEKATLAALTQLPSEAVKDVAKTLLENINLNPKKAVKMAKSCIQQGDNAMAFAILEALGKVEN